jgi:hypothetical protein
VTAALSDAKLELLEIPMMNKRKDTTDNIQTSQLTTTKIVFTGGPCGGKTTALS